MKLRKLSLIAAALIPTMVAAQPLEKQVHYSPYVDADYPMNVYFGDTHLHTGMSTDVGLIGVMTTPEMAYRASRGEVVESESGHLFRLVRPLDFVVIADHAENLGLATMLRNADPILLSTEYGKRWYEMNQRGEGYEAYLEWARAGKDLIANDEISGSAWAHMVDMAEKYNEPGVFTAFHGYEWTSTVEGNNLHRVVIYRDGEEEALKYLPYSYFDSTDPEDLWAFLAKYEEKTGGSALAIPHNGNLSNGLMFDTKTLNGQPMTREYAEMRMRFEPLYEVTQYKGDSESHPFLSPDDEFADFETIDSGNVIATQGKEQWMLEGEYARSAYKRGLSIEQDIGANPYKFGLIGSSDAHNSIPSTRQENFFGKGAFTEPGNEARITAPMVRGLEENLTIWSIESAASGLAAVWARENTREAIFDAMARKETYATTGTRLAVRVFAGWDFKAEDVFAPNLPQIGYERGVPMGGELTNAPEGASPTFLIQALRDPEGANLDRIQVVKGWIDAKGETHERIFDVAVAGERKINSAGRAYDTVGSTVDVNTATYNNSIGAPQLMTYWTDPEFNEQQNAFYYIRVLEIPQPRWPVYDHVKFGFELPEDAITEIQERAYTSPIWYSKDLQE